MEKREGLTTKQRAALAALVAGCNHTDAAARAGVHANRIGEWLKDPAFIQALRQAESEALDAVGRELIALASKARENLESVLDDPEASPSVKLRAVDIVFARLLQIRELATLEERVSKLEEAHAQKTN